MMTSLIEEKRVNIREISYYLLLSAVVLFFILILGLSIFYTFPRQAAGPVQVPVGTNIDFPSMKRPYLVNIDNKTLFLVRTENGWIALDGQTPHEMSVGRCRFNWEEVNGRFVDPCSGSKFGLDGTLLEGPATSNIDQYPITEQAGELFVDLTNLIPGESAQ